ncbi:uncharacterized protein LOC119185015 isoform X2 [Rhipicephalus microplus]|uniref:uncharacterized protein LOC119185015 isoform X2 n=1 Tax=Rhipicephalus microplus TaxID=6941 RepID=UPI003F6D7ABE
MDRRWDVAGAASLTALFTTVMMMNSGFFYVSFIEEFGVTREAASWPASVMSVVSHSSGLLVSCLQRHLSVFQLGLVGSVFLWAGILAAVFAPNMAWMTVTLGVIHGYFRDVRGSYDGLYQLQAGIHCFVGALFGLLSVLDRRRQKKWTTTRTD